MSRYEDLGREGWFFWMESTELGRPSTRLQKSVIQNADLDGWQVWIEEGGIVSNLRLHECKVIVAKHGFVNACQFLDCDLLVWPEGKVVESAIRGGSTVDLDAHEFGLQRCYIEQTAGLAGVDSANDANRR